MISSNILLYIIRRRGLYRHGKLFQIIRWIGKILMVQDWILVLSDKNSHKNCHQMMEIILVRALQNHSLSSFWRNPSEGVLLRKAARLNKNASYSGILQREATGKSEGFCNLRLRRISSFPRIPSKSALPSVPPSLRGVGGRLAALRRIPHDYVFLCIPSKYASEWQICRFVKLSIEVLIFLLHRWYLCAVNYLNVLERFNYLFINQLETPGINMDLIHIPFYNICELGL